MLNPATITKIVSAIKYVSPFPAFLQGNWPLLALVVNSVQAHLLANQEDVGLPPILQVVHSVSYIEFLFYAVILISVQCQIHDQCPGQQICVNSVCQAAVPISTFTQSCTTDTNCPLPNACKFQRCWTTATKQSKEVTGKLMKGGWPLRNFRPTVSIARTMWWTTSMSGVIMWTCSNFWKHNLQLS